MNFLLMVTMSNYTVETYGVSISTAGLAASIFVLGSLLGRLLLNSWVARFGMRRVLLVALIGSALASTGYFIEGSIAWLMLTRIVHGFTIGIISTATGVICVQITPDTRQAEGISYYSLSAVLGTAVGPMLAMFLLTLHNSFYWMFAANMAVGLVCIVLLHMLQLSKAPVKQKKIADFRLSNYIDKQAIPISCLALLIGFGFSSVTSYLTLYGKDIGLLSVMAYFFIVHATCVLCSRPFTGKLMDKKGANIVVYPCLLLFAFGMLMYSQAAASWMIIVAAMCMGLGFGNFNSAAQMIAVKSAQPQRLGLATATYFIFLDLGFGLGPYVLGYIIEHVGFHTLYSIISALAIIAMPVYYIIYGQREKAGRVLTLRAVEDKNS